MKIKFKDKNYNEEYFFEINIEKSDFVKSAENKHFIQFLKNIENYSILIESED